MAKSFASHPKAIYWSACNELSPRDVFKSSNKKYFFDCPKCKHTFEISLGSINNGHFCIFCAHLRLCDSVDCDKCFKKSFASVSQSKDWSDGNELTPRDVFKSSHAKYFFDCPDCDHVFCETSLAAIVCHNTFCPFCKNKSLCNRVDCEECKGKSFASHPKAIYWSKENNVSPRDVFKCSNAKYKFDCPDCNKIYEAALNDVTAGKWCSCTVNKTETKLYNYLTDNCDLDIIQQQRFEWCKNKRELSFDFCIEEFKLIIELDGPQHFKQVSNWQSPEETQKNDKYKTKLANKHGYSVIRITQEDVWNDKNNWKKKLGKLIKKHSVVTNFFIGEIYEPSIIWKNVFYATQIIF